MSFLNKNKETSPLEQISNFRDESGVSTRRLEIGLWFIRQRKHFVVTVIVILSLTSLITLSYSIYHFSHFLIVGIEQDRQLRNEIGSNSNLVIRPNFSGSYLSASDVTLLLNQSNQSDIVAKVSNSHTRSVLNFSYYFNVAGEQVGTGRTFILPGDTKYVMALSQKISSLQSGAEIVIQDINYSPVSREILPVWEEYRADRLNFLVEDAAFTSGQESGLSEKISLGELHFKITNQGGFSYKQLPLDIVLRNGDRIVSVSRYYIENFRSGETKTPRISWPGSWSGISQIEIIPDVNILDESVYLKYSSE